MKPALLLVLCVSACAAAPKPSNEHRFSPTAFTVKVSGAGRPILFIPGLACGGDVWDATIAHLGGRFQTHVVTLAGFAGQAPIAPPFLAQVREQLAAYIRAEHLDHPVVVGHSLGGSMALWLAATEPDLLAGALVVDGMPFFSGFQHPEQTAASVDKFAREYTDQLRTMAQEAFEHTLREFFVNAITSPVDLEKVMISAARTDPGAMAQAAYELFTLDLRPQMTQIKAPVIIIAAGSEAELGDHWRAQVDPIPHHTLVFAEGSRHFVMYDKPAFLHQTLDEFLAKAW